MLVGKFATLDGAEIIVKQNRAGVRAHNSPFPKVRFLLLNLSTWLLTVSSSTLKLGRHSYYVGKSRRGRQTEHNRSQNFHLWNQKY